MGVQVPLSVSDWQAQFPEFSQSVSASQVTTLFDIVTDGLIRNDGGGPVRQVGAQTQLLYWAMAHLAMIMFGTNAQPASQISGRIDSATEGSVTVSADMGEVTNSQAFWAQTKYGNMVWIMMSPYRRMRYIPGGNGLGTGRGLASLPWTYPNTGS